MTVWQTVGVLLGSAAIVSVPCALTVRMPRFAAVCAVIGAACLLGLLR